MPPEAGHASRCHSSRNHSRGTATYSYASAIAAGTAAARRAGQPLATIATTTETNRHAPVENSVRHGAAYRVAATTITVRATAHGGRLTVHVQDFGDGPSTDSDDNVPSVGSGLARLRERLQALYGAAAALTTQRATDGFVATLGLPLRAVTEARP